MIFWLMVLIKHNQIYVSFLFDSYIVAELENEDLSEGEIERALELNKQIEMRKALGKKASLNLYGKNDELQQFSSMIEKKNTFLKPVDKTAKKISQAEAVKLNSKVFFNIFIYISIVKFINWNGNKNKYK